MGKKVSCKTKRMSQGRPPGIVLAIGTIAISCLDPILYAVGIVPVLGVFAFCVAFFTGGLSFFAFLSFRPDTQKQSEAAYAAVIGGPGGWLAQIIGDLISYPCLCVLNALLHIYAFVLSPLGIRLQSDFMGPVMNREGQAKKREAVICTNCEKHVSVPGSIIGYWYDCPYCGQMFKAETTELGDN